MSDNLIGATTAIFVVSLSKIVDEIVDVSWTTRDGTAKAGTDYQAASGVVSFLPGETTKQIQVIVYGQNVSPLDEKNFFINLSPPTNAVLGTALIEAVIKVEDEAGVPVTSVIVAQGKRGLKGDPGLSAYEQAVLMGYEGTVEQWMQEQADAAAAADRASDYASDAASAAARAESAATSASFLGNIFPNPEAGVDPVTGVGNGAYYNVRSTEDDSFLVEYQNIGGVPTPSGKSYPSSMYVQQLSEQVEDVSKYVPVKFESGKQYAISERVVLENGDIVRSTVSNNTTNPNIDMTGWENFESDQKAINDRLFSSIELSSTQYGITGSGDETAKVQTLVAFVNANPWVSKILIESDITSSELMIFSRAVEIDFNGHAFNCTKEAGKFAAGIMFRGVVDTDVYATLTADNVALSNKFTVNDASIFQIGDYVSATYKRSTLSEVPYASEDIVFTAKILNITGDDLYLDHTHGFGIPIVQPWGTAAGPLTGTQLDICKSYPVFNPKVKNLPFTNPIISATTRVNAVTLYVCIGAELTDIAANGIGGQTLHNIGCRGTVARNLSTVNPRATTGGRGYVVQENGSHDSDHDNLTGINDRHTHDASTMSSRIKVRNSRGIGSANYSFGCHASYIYDVTAENCDGSGGFHYGNSNIGNPTDGYFGSAAGEITLKNVTSSGTAAKIYLSPLVSVGTNRIIDSKIPSTSEVYGARISANTVTQNCQFATRLRVNKHQAATPTVLTDTECTILEGGQTDVVSQPDIIVRGGVIQSAQYLASLTMDGGARIRNTASSNMLTIGNFKIQGGAIEVTGATSDFTLNGSASISESTNVVVGRNLRLIAGNIEINSKNVDAELIFNNANPVKLTATGAYIRNLNMGGGGANCKLQINNSELNYVTPNASFNYVIFTGNKVNGGTSPVASARYIVDNNLIG